MNQRNNIKRRIFNFLHAYDYVLLDYQLQFSAQATEVLLTKAVLEELVKEIKTYTELEHIRMSTNAILSKLILAVKGEAALEFVVYHRLVYKSLSYLTAEALLFKRRRVGQLQVPALEHLLEFVTLKQFMQDKGMEERYFRYFDEFHILVQEGLLDYFNNKYGTEFGTLFEMTNFSEAAKLTMLKNLKTLPGNRFPQNVNIRWSNFVGSLRQARVI